MNCPYCGFKDSKVTDSRNVGDGVRRRRECLKCNLRFTTYERVQASNLLIVKKDGIREEFDSDKLASGLRKACEKRPMPAGTIQKLIDEIEDELYRLGKSEVDSSVVGEMVMERLRNLDHIAYIRFASVYRQFADIGSLKEEVDTLIESDSEKIRLPGQLPLIADDGSKKIKRNSVSRFRRNYA